MRPFKSLISLEEARTIVDQSVRPIERKEILSLSEVHGRVLAEDVVSRIDVPPFDRSAMDGYAVKADDTFSATRFKPVELTLVGEILAGEAARGHVGKGECIQIATGAPIPKGADAVVKFENTEKEGQNILFFEAVHPKENISLKGEDIKGGERVLKKGDYLSASKVGVLAALGGRKVQVYAKPKVAIIPTGSEVQEIGRPLKEGKVYDINSYTLSSIATESGCLPIKSAVIEDSLQSLRKAIEESKDCDCVVFSGGSSVGERDLLRDAILAEGDVLFHGIQIKPGKPTICGLIDEKLIFGMPGYPAACLTNGYILLAPALRRMARLPLKERRTLKAKISRRVVSALGRHQFLTVKLEGESAVPVFKESGDITSLADAVGYVEIPPNIDLVEKGQIVDVVLF